MIVIIDINHGVYQFKDVAKMIPKVVPLTNDFIVLSLVLCERYQKACHVGMIMKSQQGW